MIISDKNNQTELKSIIKNTILGIIIMSAIVTPWLIRNYIKFNELNVAGRSGAVLYARAWRADKSWRTIPDSYLSVFLGRGILYTIYPSNQSIWVDQWEDWWRKPDVIKQMWGTDPIIIDQNRKKAALEIIFGGFNNFSKFVVWTGIDELRFLQLTNPVVQSLGSPFEGTYGPLAKEGKLNFIQLLGLAIAHLAQFIWFILIFVSAYLGFKKYKYYFIPGIFLVSLLLVHSIADNIPRYGAPLQPWLLSAIFMTIIFPLYQKISANKKWKINQLQ